MKTRFIISFVVCSSALLCLAGGVKPPPGKPVLHCATFDSNCKAALLEKLKSDPRGSKNAQKIVAAAQKKYVSEQAKHSSAAARTSHGSGAGGTEYWTCGGLNVIMPWPVFCLGDDGLDIFF
jgi:hypothetical protein